MFNFDLMGMWLGVSGVIVAGIIVTGSTTCAWLLLVPVIFQLVRP